MALTKYGRGTQFYDDVAKKYVVPTIYNGQMRGAWSPDPNDPNAPGATPETRDTTQFVNGTSDAGGWRADVGMTPYSSYNFADPSLLGTNGVRFIFGGKDMTDYNYTGNAYLSDTPFAESNFQPIKDESVLQQFAMGPGLVFGTGLGVSGLMNGFAGFGGLNNMFGGVGSNGFSFPGLEGMSGFDAAGNLAADVPWGVNPTNGGGMDWWDSFMDSVGSNYGTGFDGGLSGYQAPFNGFGADQIIPSSYGASGYPSTGIFQNGAPGGGMPWGGSISLDGGAPIPLSEFYGNSLGMSPSQLGSLSGAGNLAKSLMGGGGFSLPGAGLGALLGALGGSQKPAGTTTTVQDIPDWLKPYVMGNLGAATTKATQLGAETPLLGPGQAEMMKTINGDYLNPGTNPYLKDTVDQALGQARSQFNSQYANIAGGGDNLTNSGFQEGLTRNLANTALPFYNQNYQTERGRQLGAATAAPDYTTSQYNAAFSPFTAYSNLTRGLGQQTTQPYFTNPMAGALGGAALGSQFGKIFSGGGPFG